MTIGTPLHGRTAPLNRKQQWREWSGYLSPIQYGDHHDIEYNAIREAAALIDVSPLYKYLVTGPDAGRLVDRVIVRDASRLAVGQVYYACWCDEDGKVIDDGTVARLDETTYRWTAAEPNLRWILMNARGLDVDVREVSESVAALALQGPLSRAVLEAATGDSWSDLRYFRGRPATVGSVGIDVTRTGYTGDLGYELWVDARHAVGLWDALLAAGRDHGLRPAGLNALDVSRLEAGLILLDVDYTSAKSALIAEQMYSPGEIGLGWMVKPDKPGDYVGRRALERELGADGPPRRLVGLEVHWDPTERLYARHGLYPTMPATAWRTPVPVYQRRRRVGRATSGTWSPILKRNIALGSVPAELSDPGTRLDVEWTVQARRAVVPATVTTLPFFDPPRKKA